jgi:hypothetical protein
MPSPLMLIVFRPRFSVFRRRSAEDTFAIASLRAFLRFAIAIVVMNGEKLLQISNSKMKFEMERRSFPSASLKSLPLSP